MAIEVPDWYRTVALVGVDATGAPVVVLLDSTGAIMAVMKGEYAGTLKNIAVDSSGRIVSVIRDPTSDNYIAIDANGYIAAVLKATYSGALKNVACDADGRIIMIPTDPADVWGNAISMGNAELAAVLSFAKRHDRRGNVLWLSSFENGLGEFYTAVNGTLASVSLSTAVALSGAYSCKLTAGSDSEKRAGVFKVISYPILSKVGGQAAFTWDTTIDHLLLDFSLYDGTNYTTFSVKFDPSLGKMQYFNSVSGWTDIAALPAWTTATYLFHVAKIVVDLDTGKYVRLIVDDTEYSLANISAYTTSSGVQPYLTFSIMVVGPGTTNPALYVDDVIITQNEPPNA